MALEGTLRDFGLADIFQLIGIQRKTGYLTLSRSGESVTVSFVDGHVVYAETSSRRVEERLGNLLVRAGKVTPEQLQEALRIQSSTLQRLGTILIGSRMITAKDLREVLQVQMTQIVYNLFRWNDGRYHFSTEETVEHDRETFPPLSAETVLMEGARLMDEWPLIERKIRSFAVVLRRTREGEARLKATPGSGRPAWNLAASGAGGSGGGAVAVLEAPARAASAALAGEESALLRLVDGRASVQEIIDQTSLGDFEACRILYDLLQRGLIEEARATPAPALEPTAARGISHLLARGVCLLLVAFSLLTLPWNPLLPWRARGIVTPDAVRLAASRARLTQIDLALKVFYLDRQALPQSLGALVAAGMLQSADLTDPWGRPYDYRIDPSGYQLQGAGADGRPDPSLAASAVFGASQRLVIEGGVDEGRRRPE